MFSGNSHNSKRIVVAGDHLGFDLKSHVIKMLESRGFQVDDFGTNSPDRCHYPEFALPAAREVGSGRAYRGILICGSGVGMGIVANKVKGVRAAVCHHPDVVRFPELAGVTMQWGLSSANLAANVQAALVPCHVHVCESVLSVECVQWRQAETGIPFRDAAVDRRRLGTAIDRILELEEK